MFKIIGQSAVKKLEDIAGYRVSYLIAQTALKKGIDCQLLFRTEKGKEKLYLRLQKDKKVYWLCVAKGYFNSRASCELALYKYLTHQTLKSANLPSPDFQKITRPEQIDKIKFSGPWVIKPVARKGGQGVLVNIKERNELKKCAADLLKTYPSLIVEKHIKGDDYRLLILGDRLLGAVKRIPPAVKGDGRHNIEQLIEFANQNERGRGANLDASFLKPLKIDYETEKCLEQQSLKIDSVPQPNQIVFIRQNANFTTGGGVEDITDIVHPENIKTAVKAVKALGLKIGGVDIVSQDISQPIGQTNGKIIEVNSAPSLWLHHHPNFGKGRDVAAELLNWMFIKR